MKILVLVLLGFCSGSLVARADEKADTEKLAAELCKANGGEGWMNVSHVRFTFVEEEKGKTIVTAQHVWDVPAGIDQVRWNGKDVKVNLKNPGTDEDSKAAYARWVNDSNWLVAPIKLCTPGIDMKAEGTKDVDGHPFQTLRFHLKNASGPDREFVLYIDPQVKVVRYWDYPMQSGKMARATWTRYRVFSGMNLATEHDFEGKKIRLTNVNVDVSR
jgi:hypothetical protein